MSANNDNDSSLAEEGYKILSIEPTDPPPDMEGNDWHHYVIALGDSRVRGYQRGNLRAVTQSVKEIVARMNERRFGKRGRVHLDMSVKGKKKPARK